MKKTLLILLALAGSLFAQTKSVSPTGGGLNETDNPAFRTALGGTTVGQNLFTLTNPSAITFPRINANNTVSSLSATDFRTAIGASAAFTTSSGLAGLLSDETGTGSFVLASSPTLTTPVINLGSDATGDIYYRNAGGLFTRLPIGTSGQMLSVSGGGIPSWSTMTIPSVEVTLAGSEVLTNKTLSTGTTWSSPPTVTFGSDATGDIYYRNAGGLLTRLAPGTNGHVLTLSAGIPSWAAAGGSLTNWTEAVNTAAPNATVPVVSFTVTNAATNVDAAISPKGTGALTAHVANSAASGGNKRGPNAVDLQTNRGFAQNVAAGQNSVITGGSSNQVDGQNSVISGGHNSFAAGTHAFVGSGQSNSAGGNHSSVVGGQSNSVTTAWSFIGGGASNAVNTGTYAAVVGGQSNTASGTYATVLGGQSSTASANYSTITNGFISAANGIYSRVGGYRSTSRSIHGADVYGSFNFANSQGEAQRASYGLHFITADATLTALTADRSGAGTTNQVVLPATGLYRFRVMVTGQSAGGDCYTAEHTGAIKRPSTAATTALIGSVTSSVNSDAGAAAWTSEVVADTTNGALRVNVTGAAATTIRWTARVDTAEFFWGN